MPKSKSKLPKFLGKELQELPTLDGKGTFYTFAKPADDYLEFPGRDKLASSRGFVSSGIAFHRFLKPDFIGPLEPLGEENASQYFAKNLVVFNDFDFNMECWNVLEAHGWIDSSTRPTPSIMAKVSEAVGAGFVSELQGSGLENWEAVILEIAAANFAKPLSRLWYAAAMNALYFVYRDDLKVGYLWAEYKIRMEHESAAVRGQTVRDGAQKGGEKRSQDYASLRKVVLSELKRLCDQGHSVSRAAELAFKAGIGTSGAANAKLWHRNKLE